MSYILDALKKSEKNRKRGKVPDLLTAQDTVAHQTKKRLLWPYILILALMINAGILLLLLKPWHSKKPAIVSYSNNIQQRTEVPKVEMPAGTPAPDYKNKVTPDVTPKTVFSSIDSETITKKTAKIQDISGRYQKQEEHKAGIQETSSSEQSAMPDIKEKQKISQPAPEENPETEHLAEKQQPISKPDSSLTQRIIEMRDLPVLVLNSLPRLTFSVFIYSDDPNSRIVSINGKTLKEGQALTEDIKLLKIVPDGVILSYQNYRFHVKPQYK
jgi:general secretion pathway protein B